MLKKIILVIVLGIALLVGAVALQADPRPNSNPTPEADALARAMMAAVNADAWNATGAVTWNFRGSREHLWDRERQLARVRWKNNEVLVNLNTQEGRAWQKGVEVEGEKAADLVKAAYEAWINDSFWLNPITKAFDDGTQRSLVELKKDEGRGLLVEYTSGGVTPGDAYLWIVGDDDLPTAWRMWTSNIPVGGMRATWADWQELATGARVATNHKMKIGKLEMQGVAGASTLAELVDGPDPFAALLD